MNALQLLARFGVAKAATGGGGGGGPDGTNYYVEVTIPTTSVASTLTDYPVYVDLSDMPAAFWTHVQSDGGDLRVTQSDGSTRCPVDLVSIDTGAETGELHFLAPTVSSGTDTTYRIYYGEGSLSQPAVSDTYGRNAVWADYELVFHAHADEDATGNHTLTTTGTTVGAATGAIGAATDYGPGPGSHTRRTETSAVVTIGGTNQALTWQMWGTIESARSSYQLWNSGRVAVWFDDTLDNINWVVYGNSGSTTYRRRNSSNNAVTKSTPQLWHGTFDGSDAQANMHLYRNGTSVDGSTASGTLQFDDAELFIANRAALDRGLDIIVDEYRLRLTELSSDWIAAEYANQNNPSAFYSVGSEQAA